VKRFISSLSSKLELFQRANNLLQWHLPWTESQWYSKQKRAADRAWAKKRRFLVNIPQLLTDMNQ
jgi:hypothetical protein